MTSLKQTCAAFISVAAVGVMAPASWAALINIEPGYPEASGTSAQVTYANGVFEVISSSVLFFRDEFSNLYDAPGSQWRLRANIDAAGNISGQAELRVTADSDNDNDAEVVFESSALASYGPAGSGFGYDASAKRFEFVFIQGAGPSLTAAPAGTPIGVIIDAPGISGPPSFSTSFADNGTAFASSFVTVIPEPAALTLICLPALALLRRRSKKVLLGGRAMEIRPGDM